MAQHSWDLTEKIKELDSEATKALESVNELKGLLHAQVDAAAIQALDARKELAAIRVLYTQSSDAAKVLGDVTKTANDVATNPAF